MSHSLGGDNLEVEVKFLLPDLEAFRERLVASGAKLEQPRTYERNVRYDNAWQGLKDEGKLLRLRRDRASWLTFKGPPRETNQVEARVREELELEVSSFDIAASLLRRIGFEPHQIYEKYRETYTLGPVEVVLDEMPFGDFVELEGEEAAIQAAAEQLGLDWSKRVLDNYLALMARLRALHDLDFDDLTFSNFENLEARAADLYGP